METEVLPMTKKKKNKNSWQIYFCQKYIETIKKSEYEQMIDAINFLKNVKKNESEEQSHQRNTEILDLKYLMLISLYFKELTEVLKEQSECDSEEMGWEIETNKITEGEIFSSFNDLCRRLDIKPPNGKRQREQYKAKFRKYFDYIELNNGNSIMILEVFEFQAENPIENSRGKYIKEMQFLILNFLLKVASKHPEKIDSDGYMEYQTTNYQLLYHELKLINPYLQEHKDKEYMLDSFFGDKYPEYFQNQGISYNRMFLHNRLRDKMQSALSTALRKLNKVDEMIDLKEFPVVKIDDLETGKWQWMEIHSQKENTYIKNVRKNIARSLGEKNSWDCLYHGKQVEFEQKLHDKIYADKGWSEIRYRIKIGFNINHILEFIGDYTDTKTYKRILSDNIALALNQAIEKAVLSDNQQYLSVRQNYIESLKKHMVQTKTESEIQQEYDAEHYYKGHKYREGFTESQNLMIGYIVNPDELKNDEIKTYRKQWLNKMNDNKREILGRCLTEEEDGLFLNLLGDVE